MTAIRTVIVATALVLALAACGRDEESATGAANMRDGHHKIVGARMRLPLHYGSFHISGDFVFLFGGRITIHFSRFF